MGHFKAFDELIESIQEMDSSTLEVGYFDDDIHQIENDTHKGARTIAYIAQLQELGLYKRPFMRPAIHENSEKWNDKVNEIISSTLDKNSSYKKELKKVGELIVSDLREEIDKREDSPITRTTKIVRHLREKGYAVTAKIVGEVASGSSENPDFHIESSNTTPLKETGQLYKNTKYVIRDTSYDD